MSYTVDAVSKAIELLFLVAEEGGNGVTELAKRSGNTKARAFRLLTTLEECGLVRRQLPMATYSLGYRALILGTAAQGQLSLVNVARDILQDIGNECNESVLVRVRDGMDTVCVAWWDAPHAIRVHSQLGDRRPLFAGASGKLLLAYAPADVQAEILSGKLQKFTPNTIIKQADLKKELKKILAEGFSISHSEKTADMVAVAAPVRDSQGNVVASLSMTAPSSRVPREKLDKYVKIITQAAARFSQLLGYVDALA
ncbi:IclR family transcriptional regulator [Herbaspirillum huttiense F1]|uniref:IclR family transcriptional regulator n=1 Tax=Herbaspirillum TaxID=963 RepID=UPI002864E4A0|nr:MULTISPECIES: IclR family transcriptional regulator [Herbaspirillum]MDR6738505.1 DNA-binding IclR family transcriptional regulator [Herbaspirillum sp. 1173]MDT0358274.1 IclR family transcriptional regulator [Herbaspirillum huttiense F1]BEV15710.1 IclR family transcriptional regulator [Herbaspirillum sp. DW155]